MSALISNWSENGGYPNRERNRRSAVNSYRLVWGLWIGLSLVYIAEYCHLAVLSGRLLQGRVLVSVFLIQAVLVPAYIWREKFSSCTGAAIQAASAAVSIVGIPAIFLVLTVSTIWSSGSTPEPLEREAERSPRMDRFATGGSEVPQVQSRPRLGFFNRKRALNYSRADDFIEWLQNPENTRYEEWEKASTVFGVYDHPEQKAL